MRTAFWGCLTLVLILAIPACGSKGSGGCRSNVDCAYLGEGYICNQALKECRCVPKCSGLCCGDDGCGGTCPDNCAAKGLTCDIFGSCECVSGACTNGQRQCNGSSVMYCDGNQWVQEENCATYGQICDSGACSGGSCTHGSVRCSPSARMVVETCVSGVWHTGINCTNSGLVCLNGTCQPGCPSGQRRCNSDLVEECDGVQWSTFLDCAAQQQRCESGQCVGCPTSQRRCNGTVIESCDGWNWQWQEDCGSYGEACQAAVCVTACENSTRRCNGSIAEVCIGFVWNQLGDCASMGQFCVLGECLNGGQPGMPCPFESNSDGIVVNGTYPDCAPELTCLGIDADNTTAACGTYEECLVWPSVWNPECASNSWCGVSICSPPCNGSQACDLPGFSPMIINSGDCFCLPSAVGPAGVTESCECPLTPSAPFCQDGLTCVWGNGESFCTLSCENDSQCMSFNPGCCLQTIQGDYFCHSNSFCG